MQATLELLKSCYLFQDLPENLLQRVSERIRFETFRPREVIFREGQEGDTLFLLHKGSVEIRKKDRQSGIEFHLNKLEAPAAFGEISLLKTSPRTATVMTLSDTEVAMLKGEDFQSLLHKIPEFAIAVSRSLASRVDELSRHHRISFGQLSQLNYDPHVLGMLPHKTIQQLKALPLSYNGTSLSVAMVNPDDLSAMESLRQLLRGVVIEPVVVSEADFKRFMQTVYQKALKQSEPEEAEPSKLDISGLLDEIDADLQKFSVHDQHTVDRLSRELLVQAVREGASELHLEPRSDRLMVRLRLNGRLQPLTEFSRAQQTDLINRLKSMAGMDLTRPELVQQGSLQITENNLEVSFAVNTLPTRYGEKMVISMPETGGVPSLERLIQTDLERQALSSLITTPYGLILMLGPQGSGKTTTMYSLLRQMAERNLNIYAIGDQISYELDGINRVDTGKQLSVANALQGVLRQHADVILLEEIPDFQTLQLALDAALTGHLILSVMQASNLDTALMRHELQGGSRQMMIDALAGVITQRLVRKLCPNCREAYSPDAAILKRLELHSDAKLYRPKGCSVCNQTGYRGRIGIYETLVLDAEQREQLQQGGRLTQLYRTGQRSLKDSALEMVSEGLTTPQELLQELVF